MSRVFARLFVLAALLMSAFVAPLAMAADMSGPHPATAAMTHEGDRQSGGMDDCGAPAAPHCQIDCVLCHALTPEPPLGRIAAVAYLPLRPAASASRKAWVVGVDPPVPRWSA